MSSTYSPSTVTFAEKVINYFEAAKRERSNSRIKIQDKNAGWYLKIFIAN